MQNFNPECRIRIGVLGPNQCGEQDQALGYEVGAGIAARGGTLVCGGMGGMMEAAAKGAKSRKGLTVGILPGEDAREANAFIDVPLPTGLGAFRNILVVRACHAVIAIRGQYGTLSEIAFALRLGIPVVGLHTWALVRDGQTDAGIHAVSLPQEAVELAFQLAGMQGPMSDQACQPLDSRLRHRR